MNIPPVSVRTKTKIRTRTVILIAATAIAASMAIFASASYSILSKAKLYPAGYTPGYSSSR